MASVGIGAGLSLLGNTSDSAHSTTKSDIAAGTLQIRNGDASAVVIPPQISRSQKWNFLVT